MKNYLTLALILLLLVGCDKNLTENYNKNPQAIPVKITNSNFASNTMESNILVGIHTETQDYEWLSLNLKYLYNAASKSMAPTTEEAVYIPEGETDVRLYAYAPYTSEIYTEGLYQTKSIFIETELDQEANGTASSDILWGAIDKYAGKSATLSFEHKFTKININISSQTGKNLSDAKVKIHNVVTGAKLKLSMGSLTVGSPDLSSIKAYKAETGRYEVIIPPQDLSFNIEVILDGESFFYRKEAATKLIGGNEYTYNIAVKDRNDLPFTAKILYNGSPLGDVLTVPATSTTKSIEMTSTPTDFTYLKIRNKNGGNCWAKIVNENSKDKDVIYHGIVRCNLIMEENFGAERTMVAEFYNTAYPKFVHKSVTITQQAATNYFTIDKSSVSTDLWGNCYDTPEVLKIQSNRNGWILENNLDWVTVEGYSSGTMNQTLKITVAKNETGNSRTGTLKFKDGETDLATYTISQSNTESKNFTLKYELNFVFTTTGGKFFNSERNGYADKVMIFKRPIDEWITADFISYAPTGFVTDAPTANQMKLNGLRHEFLSWPNYSGSEVSITPNSTSIVYSGTSETFFRSINYILPAPAGVKRNQMVKFHVTVNNIEDTNKHDKAIVTSEIINQ